MEKRDFDLFLNRALDSGIPVELVGSHRYTSIKALTRSEYKDLGVEKSQSQIKSLISQKTSHSFHAHPRRTLSHGMYPDLEKIKRVKKKKKEIQKLNNPHLHLYYFFFLQQTIKCILID